MKKLKKNLINRDEGFIVQVLFLLFYVLERISVFYWVRVLGQKLHDRKGKSEEKAFVKTYIFPEIWAVTHLILSYVFCKLIPVMNYRWMIYVVGIYAALRIMEMFVYQFNVMFFHRLNSTFFEEENAKQAQVKPEDKPKEYYIKSSTRTVLMLLLNMLEYILQFEVIFAVGKIIYPMFGLVDIRGSFQLFMNLGYLGEINNTIFLKLAYVETLIGLFFNLLCLARFIGMLPDVKEAKDVEKK